MDGVSILEQQEIYARLGSLRRLRNYATGVMRLMLGELDRQACNDDSRKTTDDEAAQLRQCFVDSTEEGVVVLIEYNDRCD